GETYDDPAYQDQVEAEALYSLLEAEVVPTFYDRGADGLPRSWIARMKASIGNLCHAFNSHRMVCEYAERFYLPAVARYEHLSADGMAQAEALAAWKARVKENWTRVYVEAVNGENLIGLQVGDRVQAHARVHLGSLAPEDVTVELYMGRVDAGGQIVKAETTPLQAAGLAGAGRYLYEGSANPCRKSGLHGYTVRVLPHNPGLTSSFLPGLIVWANKS
nr:alpha-glucan phosphorylase [Anaerolineae bacterium]